MENSLETRALTESRLKMMDDWNLYWYDWFSVVAIKLTPESPWITDQEFKISATAPWVTPSKR